MTPPGRSARAGVTRCATTRQLYSPLPSWMRASRSLSGARSPSTRSRRRAPRRRRPRTSWLTATCRSRRSASRRLSASAMAMASAASGWDFGRREPMNRSTTTARTTTKKGTMNRAGTAAAPMGLLPLSGEQPPHLRRRRRPAVRDPDDRYAAGRRGTALPGQRGRGQVTARLLPRRPTNPTRHTPTGPASTCPCGCRGRSYPTRSRDGSLPPPRSRMRAPASTLASA